MDPVPEDHRTGSGRADFIEQFGLQFEANGIPRMAGRIFGLLLISSPPELPPAEIKESLSASISSVSAMLRILGQLGVVEPVSRSGERAKRYRIAPGGWQRLMMARLRGVSRVRELLDHGRSLLAGGTPDSLRRIEEMDAFYGFMEGELARMARAWEERHGKREDRV